MKNNFRYALVVLGALVGLAALTARPVQAASGSTTVTGTITESDGVTAVPYAWTTIHNSSWSIYQGTSADSNGVFTFSDLPSCSACTVEIYANNATYADPDPIPANVVAGQTLDLGVIRLLAHNIIGQLVAPDGSTAIPYVSLSLQSSDYTIYKWTTSDSEGRFRFRISAAGSYTLSVSSDYISGSTRYYAPANSTVTVADPSQTLDIGTVQMKNANVTGTLTEPDGSTPVPYASISTHDSNWSISKYASTADNGTFGFYLPAGRYSLDVWANSATYDNPAAQSFSVTAGQTTALGVIELVEANAFFKVTRMDGATPVSGASINVHNSNWSVSRYKTTDADGEASMSLPAAGTYTVEIYANDSAQSNPDPFTITYASGSVYYDGTHGSSVIRLQAPSLRGLVQRPDGTAAANAQLYLFNSTYTVSRWASTSQDGSFIMPAVPTGTYTLQVTPPWDANGLIGPDDMTLNLTNGSTNTTYETNPIVLTQALKTITGTVRKADGAAVTNAQVNAWKSTGSGWAQTTTNSSGRYTLLVGRGDWSVSIYPDWASGQPDWGYFDMPASVSFDQSNNIAESETLNFEVATFSATIRGSVRNPDGTIPNNSPSVSCWSQNGTGNYTTLDAQGNFSLKVAPATYNVDIYSPNVLYASPEIAPVKVSDGEIKDLGTLTLVEKKEFITGRVTDSNGTALANQSVSAWKARGNGWAWTTTDETGSYSLSVSPGAWFVDAYPSFYGYGEGDNATQYVRTQSPQQVSLNANETLQNINFSFAIADATISGTVQDEAGNLLSDLYGWLDVRNANQTLGSEMDFGGQGGEVQNGRFSVKVSAGSYNLGVWLPYQSGYTASSETAVTIDSGETVADAVITMIPNDVTLTGTVRDADGNALTSISGSVYATNGAAGHQWAEIRDGAYQLELSRGTWRIGYWVDPRYGYLSQPLGDESKLTLESGEARTFDLTLRKLDSTISGTVLDPDGNPLSNAWISIDTEFGGQRSNSSMADFYGGFYNQGNLTDGDGQFSIDVPQGEYFVSASLPTSFGYINPAVQQVTVDPETPANLNFQFRQSDATISGSVTLGHTTSLSMFRAQHHERSPAYVWGWSEAGGFTDEYTNTGDYTLNVTKGDVWHIGAIYETTTSFFTSSEHIVVVDDSGAATENLEIVQSTISLPASVTATFSSNVTKVIKLEDGTTITIPANALSSTEVDVTVTATPKAQLPNQANAKLFTIGYDLLAKYASGPNTGQTITSFVQDVTISLPFTDEQLEAAGITADALEPMYWDTTTGSWKPVDNIVVDEENHLVSFTVRHFTSFGLIQSITIPAADGLTLTVTEPTGGQIVRRNYLTVAGTVSDPSATVTLSLNGGSAQTLDVDDAGAFSTTLTTLQQGANNLSLTATKNSASGTVEVSAIYSPLKAGDIIVTVPKFGSPHVRVFDQDGNRLASFFAYSESLRAKLNVLTVDLDGDGADEIVTYLGEGYAPHVRVFNQQGVRLADAFIYHAGFRGGVQLTTGDINGDGRADLIFAPAQGGGSNLRAYTYNPDDHSLDLLGWTMAYQSSLQLKMNVAAADVNADGADEIIVAPAEAGGPNVRVYAYDATDGSFDLVDWFMAYADSYRGGVELLTVNVSGDSTPEIVVAPTTGGPNVRAYSYSAATNSFDLVDWFMAYAENYRGGVEIAAADIDNDGWSEIITAPTTGGPNTRVYGYVEADHEFDLVDWFMAYDESFRGGVQIATGDVNGDGHTDIITAPKQDGSANVRVYTYTEATASIDLLDWLMAYQTDYRQPIELAVADLDANGDAEITVTPLGAGGPNVRILDFADNDLSLSSWFMAYADSFRGGVRAAVAQQ